MFGTIRKHQQWLWWTIIVVIIVSFVFFFSPYSKVHDENRRGGYGSVNGKEVTQDDLRLSQREVMLRYFFMTGDFPDQNAERRGFDLNRETYQWLFLISKQEEAGIQVSPASAARTAHEMLSNFGKQGLSSPAAFEKNVLQPRNLTLADFERFVRHYVGLQQLIAVAGSSGKLVTPQEAKDLYIRLNQPYSAEAVIFSASNYLSKVVASPQAVSQFFSNYLAYYRIPERVQVTYVKFPMSNYIAQAESELSRSNLNQIIDANMQRMGTNLWEGAKTAEESRAKLRERIIKSDALSRARRAANAFARPIFESATPKLEDLIKAAQAENLKVATSEPFDRNAPPAGMDVDADFVKFAFSRTEQDPFAQPYVSPDGVYVFGLAKRLPSEAPSFEKIHAKVENDYKLDEAAKMAFRTGMEFRVMATNGITQGKSFADVCKAAGVKPLELPPVSLSTRNLPGNIEDKVPLNAIQELIGTTEPGKVSQFQPTRDGGVVMFVKSKLPLEEAKLKQELPMFTEQLRRSRTEEAFQAWFRKEGERGLRNTPLSEASGARAAQQQGKK